MRTIYDFIHSNILNMKIKRIFEICGYKDYEVDKWYLNIRE